MSERVLITGGAGFLGSALAECLCDRYEVVVLDVLLRNALQYVGLIDRGGVTLIRGDVLDADCVAEAVGGCKFVVHMASVAGVSAVEADPVGTMRTVLIGTANLLEACRGVEGLRRVVILSSSEVYGRCADRPREDDALVEARTVESRWSYAVSKLAAEYLGLSYYTQFGLPVTVVRPFNIYGPAQVGEGAVHTFVTRALSGLPLMLHNGGGQVRAWCYIDDLTDGILRVLEKGAAEGEVFNLGNPECTLTIKELAGKVVGFSGSGSILEEKLRPGPEVHVRIPDISKARRLLGFAPRVSLDEGLRRTVDWYSRHGLGVKVADG